MEQKPGRKTQGAGQRDGGRLLLIDDHQFVRQALRGLLADLRGVSFVDEASSLGEAIAAVAACRYDLALLDLDLPDSVGLESYFRLVRSCPDLPVALVTGDCALPVMEAAMLRGARGFVAKTQPPGVIQAAVALMLAGERFVPSVLYFSGEAPPALSGSDVAASGADVDLAGVEALLSPRLIDVLRLIVEGKSNREISEELSLSPGTVKNYVANLFERLGQPDRRRTIRYVMQLQSRRRLAD